ncbi:unnamed protein product [Nezara viridula]|uniref:Uncharacterized protein n=1 Tax=Nezara viridula TaxID=85310 RepID=A0A9P0HAW1_NEZVI|nr:unnamed protein product [Nezara viridula]
MSIVGKFGVRHVQAFLLSCALVVNHMHLGNLGMAVVVITQKHNERQWKRIFYTEGFVKPVVYNLAARWLPTEEMLLLGPAIICGLYTGVCFMLMMGGYLGAGHGGWHSIFYFSGNCGLLWSLAFYGLGFASPNDCYYISELEKNHINDNVPPSILAPYRHNIPWRKIFSNIPLWTVLVCQFANNWSFNVFVKIWPVYLQHKLHFELHETGIICGTPFLFVSITVYAATILFHYLWNYGKLNFVVVRHVCNAIAQFGAAYSFMVCSSSEKILVTVIFHHIGVLISSLQLFGFYMNYYDLSPTYVGLTSGICNGIASIASIVGPHVTLDMYNQYGQDEEAWTKDRQFIGWRKGYDLCSLIFFIGGTAFMFLGQVKRQEFDNNEQKKQVKKNIISWSTKP